MGRLETEGGVKVVFEIAQSLARVGVNQVEAEVFEASMADNLQSFHRFVGGMNPAEKLEQMGLERLHADADTIHPARVVAGEVCTFYGSGVGLQGNLAARLDIEQRGCAFENATDARRLKGRWSPTAEEDRLDASTAPMIHTSTMIQLLNQCCCVIFFRDFRNDVGIKIAVRTFADAIGNMNVEGKGLFVCRHDSPIILTKGGCYNS